MQSENLLRRATVLPFDFLILAPNLSTMEDHKNSSSSPSSSLLTYPLKDYSTSSNNTNTSTTTTTFFTFLGEWMILFITCSLALFFIPLTPSFTLYTTSSSSFFDSAVENRLTTNLAVTFSVDNTNPLGGTINYSSFNASLFQHQKPLLTFSLQKQDTTRTILEAEFRNVSVTIDEWGHHRHGLSSSCGFAYLDLWFSVDSSRDKLQGHCGDVKFELCSSSSGATNVVAPSFLAACDVYSELVHRVRLGVLVMLILLLVGAAPVPILIEHFFCFES